MIDAAFIGAFGCLPVAVFIMTLRLAGVIGQRWACVLLLCVAVITAILAVSWISSHVGEI